MRAVLLTIWIVTTFLIASHTEGGAEVCHSELRYDTGITRVVQNYVITNPDVEIAPIRRADFDIYYHPFGETTTEPSVQGSFGPVLVSRTRERGAVWEDSCGIGDNENAGYQLKIFSKQDPRTEKFDKPILITQGFDANYLIPDKQFGFGASSASLIACSRGVKPRQTRVALIGIRSPKSGSPTNCTMKAMTSRCCFEKPTHRY